MAQPSDLDQWVELLSVGPFGGLDPTTNPYFVGQTNFVSGENFVPNHGYGGFVTVMGRNVVLAAPLPGNCTGMHTFHRQDQPDVYLFAVDIGDDPTYAAIMWAPLGGIAAPLELPESTMLTAGQQTYFADCSEWVFMTNGVDRPLKIDTKLAVTYWGILQPTVPPLAQIVGAGPLLGTYYYCTTFGNDVQESSQGPISASLLAATTTATSTTGQGALQLSGKAHHGDVISIFVGSAGASEYRVDYVVPDPAPDTMLALVQDVAQSFNTNPFVTVYATAAPPTAANAPDGQIILTAAESGSVGNRIYYYAQVNDVSGHASLSILPHVYTLLAGGTDGSTVLVDLSKMATTDPQVTEMNLYRLGGSLGTWNLITTVPLGTKHYYDGIPDSSVVGQQLVVFRDAPPPFSYIATHMERIFGFGINAEYNPQTNYDIKPDVSVMWWSNLNEPWGFNSEVNNFTCGDNKFSDVAVGLMELGGVLLAAKSRRCYFVFGSTDDDFQPIFAWFIGCDAPRSIATGYGMGFWHSRQGVHMTDGSTKQQISDAGFAQSNVKNILDRFDANDFAQSVGFVYDRQYYLSFPTRDITLIFDTRDQQWYQLGFSLTQVTYDLESDTPVVGMDNKTRGQVDKWFDGPCDFTGVVTGRLTSRTTDGGIKHGTKRLERALLIAPIQPGACVKVIVTGDPDCITQVSSVETIDLGNGFQRHEWALAESAGGNIDCDTFNVTLVADGPTIIDTVSVYGWVVRVHAMGGPRSEFVSAGGAV